jgi:hypothetical protein
MSATNNLPPQASGRKSGEVELVINKLAWKTSKTYSNVNIKITWWGQEEGVICRCVNINNKNQVGIATVVYNIRTKRNLFRQYLSDSDPIEIQIYSTKTNRFIGCCSIAIPKELLLEDSTEEIHAVRQCCVFTNRCFSIGVLEISLKTTTNSLKFQSLEAMNQKENLNFRTTKSLSSKDKENLTVVGHKKKISFRNLKPLKPPSKKSYIEVKSARHDLKTATGSSTSSNVCHPQTFKPLSSLRNFLDGSPLTTRDEENQILINLRDISPSQSIIESLQVPLSTRSNIFDGLDYINMSIQRIELSEEFQLEAQTFMNKTRSQRCVIKTIAASKSFEISRRVKIISPVFESAPQSKLSLFFHCFFIHQY